MNLQNNLLKREGQCQYQFLMIQKNSFKQLKNQTFKFYKPKKQIQKEGVKKKIRQNKKQKMLQNNITSRVDELKDDNIIKINKIQEEEFIKDIDCYNFPLCQKDQEHCQHNINYVLIKKQNQLNDNPQSPYIQAVCEACLQSNQGHVLSLKQFLLTTYQVANNQCDKNSFKECINETLILLEENLKKLNEVKERIEIYCEEVREKINNLQQKAQFYPPQYVRDILTRIKDSKDMNQDEKSSTILSELAKLSSQIIIDERANYQPIIKGATLDISLYYLLLHKVKCDTNIINQCLDRGCFILNDIDQSENIPQYGDRIIKNIKQKGNLDQMYIPIFDQKYQEYKKKMEFVGLQENELNIDKTIDFHILYKYEQYKFQGIQDNVNMYIPQSQYKQFNGLDGGIRVEKRVSNEIISNNQQIPFLNMSLQYKQHIQQDPIQNQSSFNNHSILLPEQSQLQNKQPSGRRIRIFDLQSGDKENRAKKQ